MKEYNHLLNYLHRWTLCKIGKFHARIHHILASDGTPFLHSHPFWYVSFIFEGGYTEQVLVDGELKVIHHTAPAIIIRSPTTYHRISNVVDVCKTLFFTWRAKDWNLMRHSGAATPDWYAAPSLPGVYRRYIKGTYVYSKFDNGVWWLGAQTNTEAERSTKLSVHQNTDWDNA
jgi:hypothetical protein